MKPLHLLHTPAGASHDEFANRVSRLANGGRAFCDTRACKTASAALNRIVGRSLGKRLARGLEGRSEKVADQVAPFIHQNSRVLDIGCGSAEVAKAIQRLTDVEMTITDVVDYNKTDLVLTPYDGKTLPFLDASFDTTLLLTVLHHAHNPLRLLDEAERVTAKAGRIAIIESVYFNELHKQANRVLDWFYNNVLNSPDVPVPWNFMTPGGWEQEFANRGLCVVAKRNLGIDQPLVPEWHVLYVIEKPFSSVS